MFLQVLRIFGSYARSYIVSKTLFYLKVQIGFINFYESLDDQTDLNSF